VSFRRVLTVAVVAATTLVASSLAATAAHGAETPARKRVRQVPASIVADCSVDVTGPLQQWIQSVPNSSTLRFGRKACYRIDATVTVAGRRHLTLDGRGATLQAVTPGDQGRRHLLFVDGTDLVVQNLTIRGAHPTAGAYRGSFQGDKAFQHAFSFLGVTHARLDHVQAYGVFGDFVYIGSDGKGVWSRDITVTDSTFQGSGRQGISITAGKHIVIDRNTVGGVGLSLIDLESNTPDGGALDVRITRNRTGAAKDFWLANKGVGTQIGDIVVEHNWMTEATGALIFVYGPNVGYRGPFRFVDNQFIANNAAQDEGSKGAFFLSRASGVLIRGNTVLFPVGKGIPAVENRDSENVVIENNTFTGAAGDLVITHRDG